jgi:hypothetical protein
MSLYRAFGAVTAVAVLAGLGRADIYRDAQRHFTLEVPEGWQVMPAKELKAINELTKLIIRVDYVLGFRPKGALPMSFPYVLAQFQPGTGTYAEIEGSLGLDLERSTKKTEKSLGFLARNLQFGKAVLDRAKNRIILRGNVDVAFVGRVQVLSVGHLGSRGVLSLHCYARDANFERLLPTFERLNGSFRFDEGYTYRPFTTGFRPPAFDFGPALIAALVGAAVAGFCYLIHFVWRKLSKAAGWSP